MNADVPGLSIYPQHRISELMPIQRQEKRQLPLQIKEPQPKSVTFPMNIKDMMNSSEFRNYQKNNPTSTVYMAEVSEKLFYSGNNGMYAKQSTETIMTTDRGVFEQMIKH